VQVLPGGRYLIPYSRSDRVVELDQTGKVVWEVSVPQPTCAARLPGGTLLVGSHRNHTVKEIDRSGKVLWEHKAEGQVFRVRVR
jgi:outer membrane protein assembly factor BamB